ncbi:AAA family ATPase [Bradyrhizobium sp. BRP22]|uniref:AAA family ATPase n=1 Tax=Bradyrhizobium sp. BRP22 TaxID=2793821 RepID=UPI001CD630F4|nr:AAA family ATPase [Bradyrhizobium sp. BRP22]MCA1458775.1 AAA family ATPase [Bradyrhizobium sp. BRP22]
MMDMVVVDNEVCEWLDSLGFRQYQPAFTQNAIAWELVPELTDQDLRELGVLALGHRKQLLRAIRALRQGLAVPTEFEPQVPTPYASAERRQITVLTCDLVNSVTLSGRFDPEDLADIIAAYQSCCEGVVRQFDGYVARFTGDGLKAYFGYPQATEYDPERAVRAGLAIVSAVKRLELYPGLVLSTRVGIATSDVVVGEIIGTGEAQERTVAGEAPNLAARLQQLGEPDCVIISDTTQRLIGRLFEYFDLGRNSLKGFAEPVQAWRVLTEGTASHFEAVRTEMNLTPLTGRDEELALLRSSWLQAKSHQGQIIVLSGEAGVGKSRLALALRRMLAEEPSRILQHHCSPYRQNSAFYPIIKQLERDAQFSSADTAEIKLEKLEELLSESELDTSCSVPLFASLLSIPTKSSYVPLSISPRQQKRLTLHALETRLARMTEDAPLLIIFEDVHWIDPSTREFLDRLAKRVASLPVLLMITCRPEFEPAWENSVKVTTCVLERLPRHKSESIVTALDPCFKLASTTRDQILDYADGLPLFLEELSKSALEAKHEQDKGRAPAAKVPTSSIPVPRTLHDSLLARLDRLGPQKQVAQIAAVIGRCFTFKLLSALYPQDRAGLEAALQGLVRAKLIVQHGKQQDPTYTFAHALLQEAAVSCLLNADRRSIHRRIARTLERDFPESAETEPELLALHYVGAGLAEPAIRYWKAAADKALQRSANVEAAHYFEEALASLDTLPQGHERNERELDLQTRLGATLTTIKGFAAPEVAAAYDRARTLCQGLQAPAQRFSVLRGLWVYDLVRAEWQAAGELAKDMLELARSQQDVGYEVESRRALGMTSLWRGLFIQAREHLEEGRRLYDPKQHRIHAVRYGNDPGIVCTVHEAFVLWMLGYADRALATSHQAIAIARQLGHPFSLVQALVYATFIHQSRGEARAIRELADEARSLALEHGFPFWQAEATIMAGWAMAAQDKGNEGLVQLRQGMTDFLATGARMDRPRWLAILAEACLINRQPHEGLEAVGEALQIVEETNECFFQARLCQLKGELLLLQDPLDTVAANRSLQQALAIAKHQQAKSCELRAATSLARVWSAQARRREAHNLLAPIYEWFTEGFETTPLKDAREQLDQLREFRPASGQRSRVAGPSRADRASRSSSCSRRRKSPPKLGTVSS